MIDPIKITERYKNNELKMDDIFIEMFGEEDAKSIFHWLYLDFEMYTNMDPDKYKTKEAKKELITSLLLNSIEYHKNKDSVWYE